MDLNSEEISVSDESYCNAELDEQASYIMQLGLDLDKYEDYLVGTSASSNISAKRVLDMMSKLNMSDAKPPSLGCGTFTGRERDKFAFTTFLDQFNNVIGSRRNLSDSSKLAYLVGYLRDYALTVVKHLSITDENYHVAIQMLEQEFMDKEFIIEETLRNIMKSYPSSSVDMEYTSIKIYLNEVRSYLSELQRHGVDLLDENSGGYRLISHIIFERLPPLVKREFIHLLAKNYPSISEIFNNYNKVLSTLNQTRSVKPKALNKPISSSTAESILNSRNVCLFVCLSAHYA